MNKNKETGLQKYSLESVLKDEELRQHLPENLIENGRAMIIAKEISLIDNDNPDTYIYGMKIKFKIVPGEGNVTESQSLAPKSISSESPTTFSNINDITNYLIKNNNPRLFDTRGSGVLIKKYNAMRLELPSDIYLRTDDPGIMSDFVGYWKTNPDKGLEITLWPKSNYELLTKEAIIFLESTSERQMGPLKYDSWIKLSNLPIKEGIKTVEIKFDAENKPYITIRVGKEYLEGAEVQEIVAQQKTQSEQKKVKNISAIKAKKMMLTDIAQQTEIQEMPYTTDISGTPYYDKMLKCTEHIDKLQIIVGRELCLPTSMIKQHLGEERYNARAIGDKIEGLVLMYHQGDQNLDAMIISKKNLELIQQNDNNSMFLTYYNNVQDVPIRVNGYTRSMFEFNAPILQLEKGAGLRFYAKEGSFYVGMHIIKDSPEKT
ncbi:MAG: hypothetical protein ACP5OA_00240 [Candidatus Woesearchaeota archaeon]